MIDLIVNYYKAYGTMSNFLEHKITHLVAGFILSLLICLLGHFSLKSVVVAFIIVFVLAVGKEIADYIVSGKDDLPLYMHVFDVIITVVGVLPTVFLMYLTT